MPRNPTKFQENLGRNVAIEIERSHFCYCEEKFLKRFGRLGEGKFSWGHFGIVGIQINYWERDSEGASEEDIHAEISKTFEGRFS